MQQVVESLPEVTVGIGAFRVFNTNGDENVCTTDQVAIAKGKNWQVFNQDGYDYAGTSGLPDIKDTAIKLFAQDGILTISGMEAGMLIQVYRLDGKLIHSGIAENDMVQISLPRGIYLLRLGNNSGKVIMQ